MPERVSYEFGPWRKARYRRGWWCRCTWSRWIDDDGPHTTSEYEWKPGGAA